MSVGLEVDGGVATVTLRRPEALNAISTAWNQRRSPTWPGR